MDTKKNIANYWPLAALILVAVLAASALNLGIQGNRLMWMHFFMGFFFCQFALLKLFNISGFADGFEMYDIIGKRSRPYALFYPFIELMIGLSYLAFLFPIALYIITIAFMAIGSIGVILALKEGIDINCPCMGTVLDVPLSTVTLTEDLSMGAMAAIMLILRI